MITSREGKASHAAQCPPLCHRGKRAELLICQDEQGQSLPYLQLPQDLVHEVSRVLFVSHGQPDGVVEELVGRTRPITHRMGHMGTEFL